MKDNLSQVFGIAVRHSDVVDQNSDFESFEFFADALVDLTALREIHVDDVRLDVIFGLFNNNNKKSILMKLIVKSVQLTDFGSDILQFVRRPADEDDVQTESSQLQNNSARLTAINFFVTIANVIS